MGCDTSKATVIKETHFAHGNDMDTFTENQIDTIRSTWPLISKDIIVHGTRLFQTIFLVEPKIRNVFKAFRDSGNCELEKKSDFIEHVKRFMHTIDVLVVNIEDKESEVDQMLLMLGAKHATFEGFHVDYFRVYSKCMLETWESVIGEEFISEVRDSWQMVFSYVTRYMTHGFRLYEQETKVLEQESTKSVRNDELSEQNMRYFKS